MSVAQTTSNATAELGLSAPQAKIQDIFTEALLDPEVTQALLARVPKDEKKALQYFRSLPAIFYTSGIRGEVDALPPDRGDITIPLGGADSATPVEQETVSPAPEPAPQPASQTAPQAEPNLVSELAAAQMEAMRPTAQPAPDPVMARVAQRPTNLSSPEPRGTPLDTRREFEAMQGQLAGAGRVPAQQLDTRREFEQIERQLADAPLSVKNNNPGNLRMVGQPGAEEGIEGFASFSTPGQGLNALTRQIVLDTQTRGLTLGEFITKYAPPSENDTDGYIRFMEQRTGVPRNRKVPEFLVRDIARAIVEFEGGKLALRYFFGDEMRAEREEATPPPVAQAPTPPPTPPPVASRASPQSIQRAARVLGPQDDIGMLASEMMMRDRPA